MSKWKGYPLEDIKKGCKGTVFNGLKTITVIAVEDLRSFHDVAIRKEGEQFFAVEMSPVPEKAEIKGVPIIERFCPHCDAKISDIPEPQEITEIEEIRIQVGDKKPMSMKLQGLKVGKINCPKCGKLIDVFV